MLIDGINMFSAPSDDPMGDKQIDDAQAGHGEKDTCAPHVDKSPCDDQELETQRESDGHKEGQQLFMRGNSPFDRLYKVSDTPRAELQEFLAH